MRDNYRQQKEKRISFQRYNVDAAERTVRNERRIKRLRYQAYLDKLTRIYNERRMERNG